MQKNPLTCEYFLAPPATFLTAYRLWGMDLTSAKQCSSLICFKFPGIAVINSAWLVGTLSFTVFFYFCHRWSIGLRSSLFAGYDIDITEGWSLLFLLSGKMHFMLPHTINNCGHLPVLFINLTGTAPTKSSSIITLSNTDSRFISNLLILSRSEMSVFGQ